MMVVERPLRMLVLVWTWRFRLLVIEDRSSSERSRLAARVARLVLAAASAPLALASAPSSWRFALAGNSHSPSAPGRSRPAVAAVRLLKIGRALRATTFRIEQ